MIYDDDYDDRPTAADLREDLTDEELEQAQEERDLRELIEADNAEIRRGIR